MKRPTLFLLLLAAFAAGSVLTGCHYYGDDDYFRGGRYGREEWRDDREERGDDREERNDDRWEGRRGWRDYD